MSPSSYQSKNKHTFAAVEPTTQQSAVRILLVDDFEPWRRSVCSMFKIQKYLQVVGEVGNGFEAVQKAEELRPDLVLLDIGLPGLNGLEAASRIRRVAPDAKILFLSQSNDADVIRAAMGNGAGGFVLKAEAGRQLLPAIEAALRGERFVSERIKG